MAIAIAGVEARRGEARRGETIMALIAFVPGSVAQGIALTPALAAVGTPNSLVLVGLAALDARHVVKRVPTALGQTDGN